MTTQTSVSNRLSLNQTDLDLLRDFLNKQYLLALRYAGAGTSYGPVSVCLSVSVSITSRSSVETDERIELVYSLGASFRLSCTVLKGNSGISKNKGTFPGILS